MRMLLAIAAATLAVPASPAGAEKRPGFYHGSTYSGTTIHEKPVHGYSGPGINSFPPGTFSHCDYQRIPIRGCTADGRCRAVAWKLYQYCY